jgi:hypothetical protein
MRPIYHAEYAEARDATLLLAAMAETLIRAANCYGPLVGEFVLHSPLSDPYAFADWAFDEAPSQEEFDSIYEERLWQFRGFMGYPLDPLHLAWADAARRDGIGYACLVADLVCQRITDVTDYCTDMVVPLRSRYLKVSTGPHRIGLDICSASAHEAVMCLGGHLEYLSDRIRDWDGESDDPPSAARAVRIMAVIREATHHYPLGDLLAVVEHLRIEFVRAAAFADADPAGGAPARPRRRGVRRAGRRPDPVVQQEADLIAEMRDVQRLPWPRIAEAIGIEEAAARARYRRRRPPEPPMTPGEGERAEQNNSVHPNI